MGDFDFEAWALHHELSRETVNILRQQRLTDRTTLEILATSHDDIKDLGLTYPGERIRLKAALNKLTIHTAAPPPPPTRRPPPLRIPDPGACHGNVTGASASAAETEDRRAEFYIATPTPPILASGVGAFRTTASPVAYGDARGPSWDSGRPSGATRQGSESNLSSMGQKLKDLTPPSTHDMIYTGFDAPRAAPIASRQPAAATEEPVYLHADARRRLPDGKTTSYQPHTAPILQTAPQNSPAFTAHTAFRPEPPPRRPELPPPPSFTPPPRRGSSASEREDDDGYLLPEEWDYVPMSPAAQAPNKTEKDHRPLPPAPIDRKQCEQILRKHGNEHSFLIRRGSSMKENYTLSVLHDQSVTHFKIETQNIDGQSQFVFGSYPYKSIRSLIQYYSENPIQKGRTGDMKLGKPVPTHKIYDVMR